MLQKNIILVSKLLRDSAQGQECTIRLPGICNRDLSTTVLCHLHGGGLALKQSDLFAAFGCSSCHDEVDRRTRKMMADTARMAFFEAMVRTQQYWLNQGMIGEGNG